MIIDQLSRAKQYLGIHPRLDQAFDYLQNTDFLNVAPGTYELDGKNLYALVLSYESDPADGVFEAHREYIDVQYVFDGVERMDYADVNALTLDTDYDEAEDAVLLKGNGNDLTVHAGTFLVFWPTDAHIPGKAVDVPKPVRKVVVKVKV